MKEKKPPEPWDPIPGTGWGLKWNGRYPVIAKRAMVEDEDGKGNKLHTFHETWGDAVNCVDFRHAAQVIAADIGAGKPETMLSRIVEATGKLEGVLVEVLEAHELGHSQAATRARTTETANSPSDE